MVFSMVGNVIRTILTYHYTINLEKGEGPGLG